MLHKRMAKLFPDGISLDSNRDNNVSVSIKRGDSGEMYDEHECIITVKSKEELSHLIHVKPITDSLREMEERWGFLNETEYPHIVNVLDLGAEYSEDRRSVDIKYRITSNIERIKE